MKRYKSFTSLIIVIALISCMIWPAHASDRLIDQSVKDSTIVIMRFEYADNETIHFLNEQGLYLTAQDCLVAEVSESSKGCTALYVIQRRNDTIAISSIYNMHDEDGKLIVGALPLSSLNTRSSQVLVWNVENYFTTVVTITFTVSYNMQEINGWGKCYQPQYISFYYTKNVTSCAVNQIAAEYDCSGTKVNTDGTVVQHNYTHVIYKNVLGPAVGTTYNQNNALSSYYIATGNGSPGEFLAECIYTYNGIQYDVYYAPSLVIVS